ncbi:MAG: ABC transporter permease [Terriglobia bacterium]|nr:MAG: ABC transporter permease [Terriglobia bacterium]
MLFLSHDLRLTFRQIRKNPSFAVTVIGTLALGIGATTAIFSLVNAILLRPLPFPHPERLVWLQQADHTPGTPPDTPEALSYPDYFDWRAQSRSFEGIASYHGNNWTLTGAGSPQQVPGPTVSANFFRVLGVQPLIGRDFLPEEEQPGVHVTMLSYAFWQSAFGGAPDVAGRAVTLDGVSYRITGVMPPGFEFPLSNPAPALWVTLARDAEGPGTPLASQRGADMLELVARLKPQVSAERAHAEMDLVARQIAGQYPDTNKTYTSALLQPMLEHLVGNYRPALRVLFAAVVALLLIACANVAGLLLVHASRRAPEIAVRTALGASRGEITRQMLVESIFLSLCGGAAGIVLSSWILSALIRYVPQNIPRLHEITADATVLGFVALVSTLIGVIFGAAPAWRASRLDPASALRDYGRGATTPHGRNRVHNWIVIGETAAGLVLLVASGLLIRSFAHVLQVDPGFDAKHVLTASLNLPDRTYSSTQRIEFYERLMSRLGTVPGVESVAAGFPLPLAEGNVGLSFQIEGKPVAPGDEPSERMAVVTAGFFRTMRIPVAAGREFTERDRRGGSPVILVNQQFARKYFPGEDPIGKRMRAQMSDNEEKPPMREIVGVVGNVKRQKLMKEDEPMYYLPWVQAVLTSPALCIRTAGDPAQVAGPLRAELAGLDPDIPLYRVRTLDTLVSNAASEPRFQMLLVTSFALLALALAAIGLYAVLSYMVAQCTTEIGLRMAIGAQPADILRWVLRRGLGIAAAGAILGLVLSAALTRYMQGMLFGVRPLDTVTLGIVSAILLGVSALASMAPALRASRLDPMQALRDQ